MARGLALIDHYRDEIDVIAEAFLSRGRLDAQQIEALIGVLLESARWAAI